MSLENPQLEDGFTPVANTIMEPICHTRLSGTDWAFLHFLWRKTYGWSKPSDIISLSQFCEGTGMTQAHVCRTIKRLLAMNVIFRHVANLGNQAIARIGNTGTATYEFNKRVWTWKPLPELAIHKKAIARIGNQPLPALAHTTDTLTTEKGLKTPILPTSQKRTARITFDKQTGQFIGLSEDLQSKLRTTYPGVDLPQVIREAQLWAVDNRRSDYWGSLKAFCEHSLKGGGNGNHQKRGYRPSIEDAVFTGEDFISDPHS